MEFQELFKLGMKRDLPEILTVTDKEKILNLGCGNNLIDGAHNLDYPDWDADVDYIPYHQESIDIIHAYHFLEHVEDPIDNLRDMQRVLKPGGIVNICVPYYSSNMAHHDLDHKSFWTERTFKNLFRDEYYSKNSEGWKFRIGFQLICGVVERNMCLLVQLIKE